MTRKGDYRECSDCNFKCKWYYDHGSDELGKKLNKKVIRRERSAELNQGQKIPKMVAILSNHYKNLAGKVQLWKYFEDDHYEVRWNYIDNVEEKAKKGEKIEFWKYDKNNEKKESFSDPRLASSKFTEIFRILRDREEYVKKIQYEKRLQDEKDQKVSRMVEIEDMNLRVVNAIKYYIESILCINCRRPNVIFKINQDTGECYGECMTCGYKNTLPKLLLFEKKIFEARETRRKLKEAGMIKCPSCGELNPIKNQKCNKCDTKLSS